MPEPSPHRAAAAQVFVADLARPELAPPPDACVVERTLHAALLTNPRRRVAPSEISAIADADARENWGLMVGFRDHLVSHRTIEAAYLALVRHGVGGTPPDCSRQPGQWGMQIRHN